MYHILDILDDLDKILRSLALTICKIFGVSIASCRLRHVWKTLHVEIGEIAGISSDNWQGAGFGGPLLLSTKNRNDITDQYYWSAQPNVRGALVVCFSVSLSLLPSSSCGGLRALQAP